MARPREFNEQEVVTKALDVFWKYGLSGSSLEMLEQNTGLKRSSFYATFGSKLNLFCLALDAYSNEMCTELSRPFKELTGRAAITGYLNGLRRFLSSSDAHKGCFMVNSSYEMIEHDVVQQRLDQHFVGLRALIKNAYLQAIKNNEVTVKLPADDAADWLLSCVRGILVGAASGNDVKTLQRSIDITIEKLEFR